MHCRKNLVHQVIVQLRNAVVRFFLEELALSLTHVARVIEHRPTVGGRLALVYIDNKEIRLCVETCIAVMVVS